MRSSSRTPAARCRTGGRPALFSLLLLLSFSTAAAAAPATADVALSTADWYASGAAALEAAKARRNPGTRARNVILFVGDGMGVSTVTASRIRAGQLSGQPGEEHVLAFETLPVSALVKTYNTNQQTPDSAGTITAIMAGIKTRAGVVNVGPEVPRGDCSASLKGRVRSLVELAEDAGLATGIISTARITHATPAAGYAFAAERNWESPKTMPPEALAAGCPDIARQLIEFDHGDGLEVVLGGGRAPFMPATARDPEYPDKPGDRPDERDLIAEWQARHPDGRWVWNAQQFAALEVDGDAPVLGLFEPSHMQFEVDRIPNGPSGEPSLAEMTAFAIERLARKGGRKGFVLLVEAGRIDHAHHAANAHRALADTIALAEAVETARRMTRERDTLIIVTADHSHTLTLSGYAERGNPILGKARTVDRSGAPAGLLARDASGKPFTTLTYANGPGHVARSAAQPAGAKRFPHYAARYESDHASRPDLTEVDTEAPNYLQEAAIPMSAESHSGEDVPLFAGGPGSQWLAGVIEQHLIFHVMREALRLRPEPATEP